MSIMRCTTLLVTVLTVAMALNASAHVQLLVPESPAADASPSVTLSIRFVHHATDDGPTLSMPRPAKAGVLVNGKSHNLTDQLTDATRDGAAFFHLPYTFAEPGAHVFYLEPAPYFDHEEGVAIVHYTKVILDTTRSGLPTESTLGWEHWEGWEQRVGFPVEIVPLNQPTALWAGNTLRAIVLKDGKPVPDCRLEIEHWDHEGDTLNRPSKAFVSQLLKTDANGVLSFTTPFGGWWAFTALPGSDEQLPAPDGTLVDVEAGGVLLVYFATPDK